MSKFKLAYNKLFEISPVPEILNTSYFPSLDGFRAISVMMVIAFHLYLKSQYTWYYHLANGALGVDIFFIISGFLITTLLLKERAKNGSINLKNFYIRRVLRIFPAAYVYLSTIVVVCLVLKYSIDKINMIACFTYLADFSSIGRKHTNWATGHFWSLAVEEQFYLFFPLLLVKNIKAYVWMLLFILVILPVYFVVVGAFASLDFKILYFITHFLIKFQGIAIGSMTSLLVFQKIIDLEKVKFNKIIINVLNIFLLVSIFYLGYEDFFSVKGMLKDEVISIQVATLIIINIFFPKDNFFYYFLNNKVIKFFGVLSYSIYIWHILFTDITYKPFPSFFYQIPINFLCILITATISYYFLEKPFLNLKKRFVNK